MGDTVRIVHELNDFTYLGSKRKRKSKYVLISLGVEEQAHTLNMKAPRIVFMIPDPEDIARDPNLRLRIDIKSTDGMQ